MSIQEANLKAIADAIREKEGSAEPIPANDFAARILAIQGGGGDVTLESIAITAPPNTVSYKTGSLFDPTGMSVWAEFSNGYGLYVNHADLVFDPAGPLEEGTTSVTVRFSWGGETAETSQTVTVKSAQIYGVEWDWTNGGPTKGSRTDDAAGFTDPVPAVNNGTGSSPFDDIMPWAGMVREDRAGGVEVKEPKYWFKWTKTGKKLKLQIANGPEDGFHVDPVNMARDDGLGELDFSYIGRYHCASGTYKSETNKDQQMYITRSAARTSIHNLGSNFWQMDFAQFWYVGMLYLVEFADWNGQATIGYGCSAKGSTENNGKTDAMQYHTGTTATSRNSYGYTQYRNIEGWWDNVFDWIDGCYCSDDGLHVIINPEQFADKPNGFLVGVPRSGYPSELAIPTQSGLEWALYPIAGGGSQTTYVPDYWGFTGRESCLFFGGNYYQKQNRGPFCVQGLSASTADGNIGCRLQERPPKTA